MKRILLRQIPGSGEADLFDYRTMLEQVIRVPKDRQNGASIDEIRRGVRVLDALDASRGRVLELEDADWDHLKGKIEAMTWGIVDRRVIDFVDDVLNATDNAEVATPVGVLAND